LQKEAFDYLDAPIVRVCGADVPMPYSKVYVDAYGPHLKDMVDAAQTVLYKK
jgi:pyruvate dehydrogenase E1 component beta subunit